MLMFSFAVFGCEAELKNDDTVTSNSSSLTNYGSSWDLTTAFPGVGQYSGISSALAASDVCSTKIFLGIPGTADCSGGVFTAFAPSFSFRKDNASINLASQAAVDARIRSTIGEEGSGSAIFSTNQSLVPDPHVDTDGWFGDSGVAIKRNYLEVVKGGRPTKVCGLSGTNTQRIADCSTQNAAKAIYEGTKYGQAGEGDWKLVTLYSTAGGAVSGDNCAGGMAGGCFEVWRDERTQLIWSDIHTNGGTYWNWFQATGYSKSSSTQADTFYEGAGPTAAGGGRVYDAMNCATPATKTCQGDVPISVCADATALAGVNGITTYQNPDGTNGTPDERPRKGNLTGASYQWRLPTMDDFQLANVNGIRKVLPNIDYQFWTSTSDSSSTSGAWTYDGENGFVVDWGDVRSNHSPVRCIGR